MWQTDWAENPRKAAMSDLQVSTLAPAAVNSVYLLLWREHCVECAIPDCYRLCPLYVRRRDRKCARFKYGISPNSQYAGLFPFGAEIEFRRWGKLESTFGFGSVEPERARLLDRMDRSLLKCIRPVSSLLQKLSPYYRINGAYAVFRGLLLQGMARRHKVVFDEFVVEAWNLQSRPVRLAIECWQQGPRFRTSILLEPGRTTHRIPTALMKVDLYGPEGKISVYPDSDAEAQVVFSWLDFVRYKRQQPAFAQGTEATAPTGNRVKCVIWDLDQTVWEGILGEQDPERVSLRPGVLHTMSTLDERGILQSIASKNDHDEAWRALERLGVAHLFLYPQINWAPKSTNVHRIAKELNIGMESCAFIDDSPFERAEVSGQLPGIRVFADSDVPNFLDTPELNVPITEESKQRREFYVAELQRKQQALESGDGYEAFLKTCKMEATLFTPREHEHMERCLELLHRSNQLNLSTHRYGRDEFARLLEQKDVMCVCTSCHDRFGDYGIVGFASLRISPDEVNLRDFVFSCRVAQKKVENAWFQWLNGLVRAAGYNKIRAQYLRTPRNGVLLNALLEVGFVEIKKSNASALLELDCRLIRPVSEIVSIDAHALQALTPVLAHQDF